MAIGEIPHVNSVREQLLAGRARLASVLAGGEKAHVDQLLNQVDEALQRIEQGTFGICEECHTEIGEEWLRENPLTTVCLEHMTPKQQRALEYDLELAGQIQQGLLPPRDVAFAGWNICYHYQPAGLVSGDYCDLIAGADGALYFIMADVSGKGVAAAMLSSNLRAVFHSLISVGLCTEEIIQRANRLFRQSALPSQYATLVCGKASAAGDLEIVNAGHLPVLLANQTGIRLFESTNPPLGLFDGQLFTTVKTTLFPGDTLVLYTDGVSEAENDAGDEYGLARLQTIIEQHGMGCPVQLVDACKQNLNGFRGGRERFDDETLLAMQFAPAAGHTHSAGAVM
jgi:phosphoserine phosphatase RsbU/P